MQARISTLFSRVAKTTWQITAASRHPGYEKNVYRIQGFVAGALFVTLVNLAGRFLFSPDPIRAKALATAWATAVIAALVYAWIIASVDRNEKEPWHMLLVSLLWGTVISATIAGLLNTIAIVFFGLGPSIAPFTEELTKGAILLLIFRYAAEEFDDALDGIVYGAMVGIGFAMAENASYFFQQDPAVKIADQMRTGQFFLRVILKGLSGHATYTAFIGLGLGLSRQTTSRALKIVLPLLGLALAIVAHGLWNSETVQNLLDFAFIQSVAWQIATRVALINGPFFVGVVIAVALSWRKEAHVIAHHLVGELDPNDPYVAPGMMLTAGARFRTRWRALWTKGLSAWWTLRRLQQSLIELAFCKWRKKDEQAIRERIRLLRNQFPK
jgi:RsiW-degrading membrane proteinase PrsW (M82 family)